MTLTSFSSMKRLGILFLPLDDIRYIVGYPPSSNIPHPNPAFNCLSNLPDRENTVSRLRTQQAVTRL